MEALAAAVQVVLHMHRLPSGARVLDTVAVLGRDDGTVTIRPVWTRAHGWTAERAELGALLHEREVSPPW